VFIHHFDFAPAQLFEALLQGILQLLAFQVMTDLISRRLTNIQDRFALQMLRLDLLTHSAPPSDGRRRGRCSSARAAVVPGASGSSAGFLEAASARTDWGGADETIGID